MKCKVFQYRPLIASSGFKNSDSAFSLQLLLVSLFLLVAKSCLTLSNAWTVACQAPLSMGFSRQEYWSGLPFPSPEDLPNQGIKPGSPELQADSLPTENKR